MHFTKDSVDATAWSRYRKRMLTPAKRIEGPFTVETKEGPLSCPDGYLAVDGAGWPYPISRLDFEQMYEPAEYEED